MLLLCCSNMNVEKTVSHQTWTINNSNNGLLKLLLPLELLLEWKFMVSFSFMTMFIVRIYLAYYNVRGKGHDTWHERPVLFALFFPFIFQFRHNFDAVFWSPDPNPDSCYAWACIIHLVGIESISLRFTIPTNVARVPDIWSPRRRLARPLDLMRAHWNVQNLAFPPHRLTLCT